MKRIISSIAYPAAALTFAVMAGCMTTPAHAVLIEGQYNIFLVDDEMNNWDGMFRVDSIGEVVTIGNSLGGGILIGDCGTPETCNYVGGGSLLTTEFFPDGAIQFTIAGSKSATHLLTLNPLNTWSTVNPNDSGTFAPGQRTGTYSFSLKPDGPVGQVPEPSALALFATGLAGLGFLMRRRRRSMQLQAA